MFDSLSHATAFVSHASLLVEVVSYVIKHTEHQQRFRLSLSKLSAPGLAPMCSILACVWRTFAMKNI